MTSKQTLKNKEEFEGKIMSSNNFGDFKILELKDSNNVKIQFIETGTIMIASLSDIKRGSVKDRMKPNVYGVGYIGIGFYTTRKNGEPQNTCYKRWKEMLGRCYDSKNANYLNYGGRGVTVCDEWKNYQNFAKWWEENCINEEFSLDKDILGKYEKIYSPKTCCFIPKDLNTALTSRRHERGDFPIGVRMKEGKIIAQINTFGKKKHLGTFKTVEEAFESYKKAKKESLKEYAEMYKDILDPRVYEILQDYPIDIND